MMKKKSKNPRASSPNLPSSEQAAPLQKGSSKGGGSPDVQLSNLGRQRGKFGLRTRIESILTAARRNGFPSINQRWAFFWNKRVWLTKPWCRKPLQHMENESAQSLKKALVTQGFVREDDILDALASEMGMDKIDLAELQVTQDLLDQIPPQTAKEYRVFPVKSDPSTLWVALSDPLDIRITDDLQRIVEKRIVGMVASEEEINKNIKKYYEGNEVVEMLEKMTDDLHAEEAQKIHDRYTTIDLDEDDADQPPVVQFVDLIFKPSGA